MFLHPTLPRPLWGSPCWALLLQAAPLSCVRPSCMGRWMRGVPSGPLSGAAEALGLMAHSQGPASACPRAHRIPSPGLGSRPGHSLQGYKDLALLAQSGLPSPPSQVQSRPSDQLSLLLQLQLSFSQPPSPLAGVAPVATRSIPAVCRSLLRVQRTRPKTAALTKLLQPAARDP